MTSSSASAVAPTRGGPAKRRLRNYLLNPRFQLKYTGLIVAVAVILMGGLGAVIWKNARIAADQSRTAVHQSDNAARQSLAAATQAERALRESQTSSRIVRMQQLAEAGDNHELVDTITHDLERADREAEANLANVQRQRREVQRQRDGVVAQLHE